MSFIGDLIHGQPDYAGKAKAAEKKRQAAITLGTQQINTVFDGGQAPFYNMASGAYDPSKSYFTLGKGGYEPVKIRTATPAPVLTTRGGSRGSSSRRNVPPPSGLLPAQVQNQIGKGQLYTQDMRSFGGFTPEFYNQRAQDYYDYAMPELARQYRVNRSTMDFGLANRGLVGGSAALTQHSELARALGESQRTIADTGLAQAQGLHKEVEDRRNQLLNQLYQSADPASGSQAAIASAASFALPSINQPIGNLFADIGDMYYQNQLNRAYTGPQYIPVQQPSISSGAIGPTSYSLGGAK